ncbi:MAG: endopeptidase La, partial [Clostridia bacterium]|nr:endopeptidase La [Clostridia bacterium]
LNDYIGKPTFYRDDEFNWEQSGVATGLAWTAVGGETLQVEVLCLPGTGKLTLTGNMGDVMQESAQAAVSLVRQMAEECGFEVKSGEEDWHVHIPEGAVQKDGPSAGITMAMAMLSACTGKPIRSHMAMTGELTLTGRVLPVGGIKEKMLAANRAGIGTVILPESNRRDLDDLPEEIRDKMNFIPVHNFQDVVRAGLS